ncbi:S1/P1 nuclease [Thalassotalea profundi]|uniref:Endonuclease n=1 Tax=Thalassotalea profundi TaxID=2036687 RepID=A0ABQ3J365_9GAMM|nr:S1/P1 nuclease [Thalassotalea profundi]GHE99989.1 hypothetical protein GCM10011501_31760 [Thalassotalea profundi]
MYTKILLSLILGLFLLTPFSSYALGKLGHQLVCQLSYDLLDDAKQHRLDNLLLNLTPATTKLINAYNYQKENSPINFAKACTWADAIKRDKTFDSYKPWHYVNVERNQDSVEPNDCKKDCLTSAIIYHSELLSVSKKEQDKVQALMFLGHWLGDIHQPLHVSFASDLGGNKVDVIPRHGQCKNLHWYWDQCLLYVEELPKNTTPFQLLYSQLTTQMDKVNTPLWQEMQVYNWANESIKLVRSEGFGYCKNNKETCLPLRGGKIEVTSAYHQKYHKILQERIVLAAHRLTSILIQVL